MINLKVLILSILISFSLQDSHCLVSFEECVPKGNGYDDDEGSSNDGGIDHCINAEGGECRYCEEGFAVSYEKNKCISFQNCESLKSGNDKCNECRYYFHPNSEGKCERTLCQYYEDDVCQQCFEGYYLRNNQCQKITIPYCLRLDPSDETKCDSCVDYISMEKDGECIVAPTLIKGCTEYNSEGKCVKCDDDEYTFQKGNCVFQTCSSSEIKYEYCKVCEPGFDVDDDGLCVGYDGTKDKNAGSITGNQNVFILILLLSLLI